jgi:hypothetical protein
MNINDYFESLERKLTDAVQEAAEATAEDTRKQLRENIPSARSQTRRAVRYVIEQHNNRLTIRVGLHFRQKFGRIQDTETARIYYAAWRRVKPRTIVTLQAHLRKQLKSI